MRGRTRDEHGHATCAAPGRLQRGHQRVGHPCASTSCCGVGLQDIRTATASGPAMSTPAPTDFSTDLDAWALSGTSTQAASSAWTSDATAAEATYGHISTWETGGVTDMSNAGFCDCDESIGTSWSTAQAVADCRGVLQRGHRRVGHLWRHNDGLHVHGRPRPSTRTSRVGHLRRHVDVLDVPPAPRPLTRTSAVAACRSVTGRGRNVHGRLLGLQDQDIGWNLFWDMASTACSRAQPRPSTGHARGAAVAWRRTPPSVFDQHYGARWTTCPASQDQIGTLHTSGHQDIGVARERDGPPDTWDTRWTSDPSTRTWVCTFADDCPTWLAPLTRTSDYPSRQPGPSPDAAPWTRCSACLAASAL